MARLRLFAGLRELAGTPEADVAGETVSDVVAGAVAEFGSEFERGLAQARIWVNGDPAEASQPVSDLDEVAIIPPVSGGAAVVSSGVAPTGVFIALIVVILGVTVAVPSRAWFAAAVVGVAAVWAIDLTFAANARNLGLDEAPLLGAIFISGLAVVAGGANGLGLAAASAVVLVAIWAILVQRDRDLVAIAANMAVAVTAAAATGGLILTHAPGAAGNAVIGAYLATVVAAGLVSWGLAQSSGRPLIDPVTGGSLAGIAAALIAAWLWDIALAGMLVVAIGLVVALLAGRGLGSLIRTGNIYLVDELPGLLVPLDGPVMAAAVAYPMVRLLL